MSEATDPAGYRVLARTYRPMRLSELIGQDGLVRTLSNAIATGRIAHAFLLTGIRGVGKTTAARIIARALNCVGPDGKGQPTPEPCGVCPHCVAITEDRHIDVLEMDAATRTGIDDIREIVESVRYAPSSARYKVYIVDEVHMLSEKAFNGLLKTLEEPPPHAKFVFATTEVRKVPVTVLSRCQRFDLRRVETGRLIAHLEAIAKKEGIFVEPEALAMIARAAEGSVRDSLSLLDQAIALEGGKVTAAEVRLMLGLAERGRLLDLLDALMAGDAAGALERLRAFYDLGASPEAVLQDLLDLSHGLSRVKVVPEAAPLLGLAPEEAERARAMASRLSLPVLARAWQMLLRGLEDLRLAPDPLAAAEMVLLRLACASDLPPPAELARLLRAGSEEATLGAVREPSAPAWDSAEETLAEAPAASPASADSADSFEDAVALLERSGQRVLAAYLREGAHLVRFEPGRIEINLQANVPKDAPARAARALSAATHRPWLVIEVERPGQPTLSEQAEDERRRRLAGAASHPAVKAVLDSFPGATIVDIRPRGEG